MTAIVTSHELIRFTSCTRIALCTALALGMIANTDAVAQTRQEKPSTLYPGGKWAPGPARYGSVAVDEPPLRMDDGVMLHVSVLYPTDPVTGKRAGGKFPVIIEHTPYPIPIPPTNGRAYLVEHGYIYAVIQARGTGASTGEQAMFSTRDGLDGKIVIDWAAHHLEGSDGRIALVGCSWPGGIALADSAFVGPGSAVKAVVAACVGLDHVAHQTWLLGGLPTEGLWNFTLNNQGNNGNSPSNVRFLKNLLDQVSSGGDAAYDREFWRDKAPVWMAQKIVDNNIPVLLWAGWDDMLEVGTLRAYLAFQNAYSKRPLYAPMSADQPATPRYQLIMGDWKHARGLDAAVFLEWIETWLKDVDTGIQNTITPAHLFETGTDRWVNVTGYPLVQQYTRWYLGTDGTLGATPPSTVSNASLAYGSPDNSASRLTFDTPAFAEGTTLAGPISTTVYASSSNKNLVLIARLYDVAPDGSARQFTKGALVGSQRALDQSKSWTDERGTLSWPWLLQKKDAYLQPGKIYRFDIPLAFRQRAIIPGHRLRLELTTQSPEDICPASGIPPHNDPEPCRLTAPQQASVPGGVYRIMYGTKWPSTLNLPQLAWKALAEVRAGVSPTEDLKEDEKPFTLPLDWGSRQ